MTKIASVQSSGRLGSQPSQGGQAQLVFDVWRHAYPEHPAPDRVRWHQQSPSIFVGSWEFLAFRQRAGLAWTDESHASHTELSDEILDQVRGMGCTCLVLPHSQGYGLKAVADELDSIRDVTARSHERGLRVALYLRIDNVIPEVLRNEYPDVDEWLTVGELGRQSHYSAQQGFRSRICHLCPAAMQYLERQIRHAVEMGADLLHLDGVHFSFYPFETCRCTRCLRAYRRWLQQRYPDARERAEVFGPVDFETISLPRFDPLQQATDPEFLPFQGLGDFIRSPDIQAWYRFRWDGELALIRHLRRFVHQLNPNVAISINPAWGSCANNYRIFTQWAERLLPWVDAVFTEDPLHLRYEKGQVTSRIGYYKLAREHDIPAFSYHWTRDPGRLEASLALSSAANGGHLACMGFTIRHLPHFTVGASIKQKVGRWVKANWQLFDGARPAAEIALLRHQPSLAWNSRSPWWTAIACEQLLVQMQAPWRMFDELAAGPLSSIKTLLLPDCVCLCDEELALLESWVREGGRVFVTAATASHNQDLRRRPVNPMASWIPAWQAALEQCDEADRWFDWIENGNGSVDSASMIEPTIAKLGRGSVGFWPKIRTHCQQSAAFNNLGPDQWSPPEQADQLVDFVNRLHGEHSIRLHGPPHTMIEHHRRSDGTDLVHVVQVDDAAEPIELTLTGAVLTDRQVRIHALDLPAPTHEPKQQKLSLRGARRYTVIELLPKT